MLKTWRLLKFAVTKSSQVAKALMGGNLNVLWLNWNVCGGWCTNIDQTACFCGWHHGTSRSRGNCEGQVLENAHSWDWEYRSPTLSTLYMDNYFSYVPLSREIMQLGILASWTVRVNRMLRCPLKTDKELKQKGRRSHDTKVMEDEDILLVRW